MDFSSQKVTDGRDGSPSRPQDCAHSGAFGERALPCSAQCGTPPVQADGTDGRDGSPSRPQGKVVLPIRKQLPHHIPSTIPPWVTFNSLFFITINTLPTGKNQLAIQSVFHSVVESIQYRQRMNQMWVKYILLMPDHLHGLFSFSPDQPMSKVIADWKRFLATKCEINWQRDFFDHRIRQEESEAEKREYIRMNPVRKSLVSHSDDWPYQWKNDTLLAQADGTDGRDGSPSRPQDCAHSGAFGERALPCSSSEQITQ